MELLEKPVIRPGCAVQQCSNRRPFEFDFRRIQNFQKISEQVFLAAQTRHQVPSLGYIKQIKWHPHLRSTPQFCGSCAVIGLVRTHGRFDLTFQFSPCLWPLAGIGPRQAAFRFSTVRALCHKSKYQKLRSVSLLQYMRTDCRRGHRQAPGKLGIRLSCVEPLQVPPPPSTLRNRPFHFRHHPCPSVIKFISIRYF